MSNENESRYKAALESISKSICCDCNESALVARAALNPWVCDTCGSRFPEYHNGCVKCAAVGIRSGISYPAKVRDTLFPPAP